MLRGALADPTARLCLDRACGTYTMSAATPASVDLARRLVAIEAAWNEPAVGAVRVSERLRLSLAKLAGVDGFRSLMSRALTMAKAEAPSLDRIQVLPDGSLEGFDGMERSEEEGGGVIVVAQLLGLLVTLIGEPLTLRLVRDAWPNALVPGMDEPSGERP